MFGLSDQTFSIFPGVPGDMGKYVDRPPPPVLHSSDQILIQISLLAMAQGKTLI